MAINGQRAPRDGRCTKYPMSGVGRCKNPVEGGEILCAGCKVIAKGWGNGLRVKMRTKGDGEKLPTVVAPLPAWMKLPAMPHKEYVHAAPFDTCTTADGFTDDAADAAHLPLARYILDFLNNRNGAELSPAIGAMHESDRELLLGELSRILRFGGHPPNWVSERPPTSASLVPGDRVCVRPLGRIEKTAHGLEGVVHQVCDGDQIEVDLIAANRTTFRCWFMADALERIESKRPNEARHTSACGRKRYIDQSYKLPDIVETCALPVGHEGRHETATGSWWQRKAGDPPPCDCHAKETRWCMVHRRYSCDGCADLLKYIDAAKKEAQKRGRLCGQPLAHWIASLPEDPWERADETCEDRT